MPEDNKPAKTQSGVADKIRDAFNAQIDKQIGNDRKHGWTGRDSEETIKAVLAAAGAKVPDEAWPFIRSQINSSQFLAFLVKAGKLDASEQKRGRNQFETLLNK